MVGDVPTFLKNFVVNLRRFIGPTDSCLVGMPHTLLELFEAALTEEFGDKFVIISLSESVARSPPFMEGAPGFADTLEPGVQRPVMVLYIVVFTSHKPVRVMVRDLVYGSSTANRLLTGLAT